LTGQPTGHRPRLLRQRPGLHCDASEEPAFDKPNRQTEQKPPRLSRADAHNARVAGWTNLASSRRLRSVVGVRGEL
jgi:hypothetical protein